MHVAHVIVALLVTTCYAEENETTFLDTLPRCHRSDPELNDCIKNVTESLREQLIAGIPELKLPSLEPLKVPSIRVEQSSETMKYRAVFTDVLLYGLSQYDFIDVDADLENLTISATVGFEHVYMDSDYMLMGTFQSLPLEESGRAMVNFTDNVVLFKLEGALTKKRDNLHLITHGNKVSVKVGNTQVDFDDVYSASDDMSKISEHLRNKHFDEILGELLPAFENVMSMLLGDFANKFFKSVPFDNLFPE